MMDNNKPTHKNLTPRDEIISIERGKLPPQAVDLEEIILGSILIDRDGMDNVAEIIHKDVFYKESHKIIYEVFSELFVEGTPIDLMTVPDELKKKGKLEIIGGPLYLIQLTQQVSSSAHIEFHARILVEKYIQRELIKSSSDVIEKAYDETISPYDLLDQAYSNLNITAECLIPSKQVSIEQITAEIILTGGKLFRNEIKAGIETPIKELTEIMGGWRDGELIILAARPGMGKTAFALLCGWMAAKIGNPVAFFTLEMTEIRLMQRIWSMECEIDGDCFTKHGLSPNQQTKISERSKALGKVPFHIVDEPAISINRLRIRAKKLKKEFGIKMIIVDYLQLMKGTKSNREQEISEISGGLAALAKELNLPVIALSQLSRKVEERGGSKRPLLSDLRESGAIEQDADVIQFIYRPEYYRIEEWDEYDRVPCAGEAEYIVAKNRNGGLCRNRMKFEGRYTKFSDLDSYGNYPEAEYFNKPLPSADPKDAFGDDNDPFISSRLDDLPF